MARSGSEKRQRKLRVGVRLTDQEYALIKEQADRAGVSMADVFRHAALNMSPLRASRHPSIDRQEICRLIAVFGQVADGLHALELAGANASAHSYLPAGRQCRPLFRPDPRRMQRDQSVTFKEAGRAAYLIRKTCDECGERIMESARNRGHAARRCRCLREGSRSAQEAAMILKGSQRGNSADLAVHLMNSYDNERVEIAEVSGTVARDLFGAFAEIDAVASGTKATKALYSLSINPPAPLTREQYYEAIQIIERRLGLTGQPRAVVFHVKRDKQGVPREHCHVVWSRINIAKMQAIHMAHDRRRLMDLACELAHKYGLDLPPGLQAWEKQERFDKEELEPTLAEKAQAEETGITPEQRRAAITACYEQCDNGEAFRAALEYESYVLARGDRRGFVIVDEFGNPHSLTRYVKGHKAKDIRAKLAPLLPEDLPTVDQAKDYQRRRRQAREEKEGEGERQHRLEQQRAKEQKALAAKHAAQRAEIDIKEQELLTRQQHEALSLHAAQLTESHGLAFRIRSAVAGLIGRTPGLRSVLAPLQRLTHLDPKERHGLEREALARRNGRERQEIGRLKRAQARIESRERAALDKKMRKATRLARELEQAVRQDFLEAARDPFVRTQTGIGEGELSVKFNDAGEFFEGPPDGFDNDDEHCDPGWKRRAEDKGRAHKPRRGKRSGHPRRSD